jgi:hypothetical protein
MRDERNLLLIRPYKWNGLWVFDDHLRGLVHEPFVSGADKILDVATAHLPDPEHGFLAYFSAQPFPGATIVLEWKHAGTGGDWYRWEEKNLEGWLCPALQKYFPDPPAKLYVDIQDRSHDT